jgi:hypothetical protein
VGTDKRNQAIGSDRLGIEKSHQVFRVVVGAGQ